MALDPHFNKTVLAAHFDQLEDASAGSLSVALRNDTVRKRPSTKGTVWSNLAYERFFAGRACLNLTTTAAYYGLYSSDTLLFSGSFTVELWVYATGAVSAIFGAINGAAAAYGNLSLTVSSGTLRLTFWGSTTDTGVALPAGRWVHLAVSCSISTASVYLDGNRIGQYARSTTSSAHNGVRVGVNGYTPTGFVGYVSDFRVYKGVAKYTDASFTPPEVYPQFGHFGDSASTPAKTLVGSGAAAAPYTADSKFGGGCLRLDGASYLECAASSDWLFGTGDFTVEAWAFVQGSGVWQAVVSQWNNVYDESWSLSVGNGNDLCFVYRSGSTDYYIGTYPFQLPLSQWVHLAVSRQGANLRLFVDGVLRASRSDLAGKSVGKSATVLRVGRAVAVNDYFTGLVDDLRITKGVARYTENFTPPTQAFPDGQATVTGVVRDVDGNLCSRKVFAHSRDTGRLLGTAVSDPVTGVYEIAADEKCYVVCLDADASYNAKIVDGVDPTA